MKPIVPICVALLALSVRAGAPRELSYGARLSAQTALERVYWEHRIWPAANPQPKPPLEAVLPDPAIRAKVERSLQLSETLAARPRGPLRDWELQDELDRMAAHSRDPVLLQELFSALGDDPFLVAEMVARPALTERLLREPDAGPPAEHALGSYRLPSVSSQSCVNDTWRTTVTGAPDGRRAHAAVWTGTEMIVWGGVLGDSGIRLATGGRYAPATDTWTPTSSVGTPSPRLGATAVWTGTEVIVWGGDTAPQTVLGTGGRYDPASDAWLPVASGTGAPSWRTGHSAVWTGTAMIVWGGGAGNAGQNSGALYVPGTDTWTPTALSSAPDGRLSHVAVWTGTEMIVWGGFRVTDSLEYLNTGGRYNPATHSWIAISTLGAPSARRSATGVWTGAEMLVWGGRANQSVGTGGRYSPATNTWIPITGVSAPAARSSHTAVWTGAEMLVWGGTDGLVVLGDGARYDPSADAWVSLLADAAPSPRFEHTALWTGTEMIVWGGRTALLTQPVTNTGARYQPGTNTWTPTSLGTAFVPTTRSTHTAVWTGAEMIVWGGWDGDVTGSGGRYVPATDSWTPTSDQGVPAARLGHTAVWTGAEMIVWGGTGSSSGGSLSSGGRYSPLLDTWTPTSPTLAPTPRSTHVAVWTGSEMIVWGGYDGSPGYKNTGGRYAPANDTWTPTSVGANVPSARRDPVGVWTGTEMIVWSGYAGTSNLTTGGRYSPATDSWLPTATSGAPAGRSSALAVWTGDQMIVWGGILLASSTTLNSGGRYAPGTDSWTPTSTGAGVPSQRWLHTGVWTGAEMLVWGGVGPNNTSLRQGARYDPASDAWTPISTVSAPPAPDRPSGVWTGSEMIVWGGGSAQGGLYCACPAGRLVYLDADGDGYGSPAVSRTSCDGSVPAGFADNSGDCDDGNLSIHSAPPEVGGVLVGREGGTSILSWSPESTVSSHDVVRGGLTSLPPGASAVCLATGAASPPVLDGAVPAAGDGFWYLVRGVNSCGRGPYAEDDPTIPACP